MSTLQMNLSTLIDVYEKEEGWALLLALGLSVFLDENFAVLCCPPPAVVTNDQSQQHQRHDKGGSKDRCGEVGWEDRHGSRTLTAWPGFGSEVRSILWSGCWRLHCKTRRHGSAVSHMETQRGLIHPLTCSRDIHPFHLRLQHVFRHDGGCWSDKLQRSLDDVMAARLLA